MKKIITVMALGSLMFTLTACGSVKEKLFPTENAGYLPTRIENFDSDGTIPNGSEPKSAVEESKYTAPMMWGTWEMTPESENMLIEAGEIIKISCDDGENGRKDVNVQPFPSEINMANWSDSIFSLRSFGAEEVETVDQLYSTAFGPDIDTEDMSPYQFCMYKMGYGTGRCKFNKLDTEEKKKKEMLTGDHVSGAIIYDVSGEKLVLGILDDFEETYFTSSLLTSSELTESNIMELDYVMSWEKNTLKLTMGEVTVEYKIKDDIELTSILEGGVNVIDYDESARNSIISFKKVYDNDSEGIGVMTNLHSGYVLTDISVNDDVLNIGGKDYKYCYSDKTVILEDSDGVTKGYSYWYKANESPEKLVNAGFFVDDEGIDYSRNMKVEHLILSGLSTSYDIDSSVAPLSVTQDMEFSYKGDTITVRATNPYEILKPLRECVVSYICIDKPGSSIKKDNVVIGETGIKALYYSYKEPYEYQKDKVVYKTDRLEANAFTSSLFSGGFQSIKFNHNFNIDELMPIVDDTGKRDVNYYFDNGILSKVEIVSPSMLYLGMQDNVASDKLENMDTDKLVTIMGVRNDILDKLREEFAAQEVNVNIDDSTGEITLDSNVLFGYDSSELSAEGKAYIEKFMKVYASVILNDEYKDYISEVKFEGHTDSTGGYDYNLVLSQNRADSVMQYCMNCLSGEESSRLSQIGNAVGYSYTDLICDENGREDATASRRVEIKFIIDL